MHLMILGMLSSSSLSAFSAGLGHLHPTPAQRAPVQPARAPGGAQGGAAGPATHAAPSTGMPSGRGPDTPPPTRLLPRGSLVDLSV
jgi:hypothetical protein